MSAEIKQSKKTNHQYTDREKQEALKNYTEISVEEIHRMYDLYDQYLQQVKHKSFKSDKYDFELHNQLSFDVEQCKRRVLHAAKHAQENYDANIETPDFEILLENYQKKN